MYLPTAIFVLSLLSVCSVAAPLKYSAAPVQYSGLSCQWSVRRFNSNQNIEGAIAEKLSHMLDADGVYQYGLKKKDLIPNTLTA